MRPDWPTQEKKPNNADTEIRMKIVNVTDRSLLSKLTIVVDASQKRIEDKKRKTPQIKISGLKFNVRFPANPFGAVLVIGASVFFPL